jgi:hypothetical protein
MEFNIDRKGSPYIEKDCIEKSQKYCNTGVRTADLNNHHECPVLTNCPVVISEQRCSFPKKIVPPLTQLELFSHGELLTSSLANIITSFEHY